ncbi:MAG: bifunctional [glutamine synthetase] adenylyltransferase/[glutamine synthetase]-adenylyl-L-tyrosine phosphorylase, partial [Pseudomonadota bacterium]
MSVQGGLISPVGDFDQVIEAIKLHAPYLARLIETEAHLPDQISAAYLNGVLQACLEPSPPEQTEGDTPALMSVLRQDKARLHLALAMLDLAGHKSQAEITENLSRFADRCCESALAHALQKSGCGPKAMTLFALGKMGAFELNYSSDIDMAAFYDAEAFDGGDRDGADAASRAVREAMRILSERTPEGYVFRTDLRLRPDPSSTPLAVSTRRAELYYESVGQNWERMVWIKGRPSAGDMALGSSFLKTLEPFVWRRHLDYWALADVQAIKSMINAKAGERELADPSADLKLGPGGIREIEFFVQTQQIILGGRNPSLRVRGTLEGLEVLVALGVVEKAVADDLSLAYDMLRNVEHRIQMLDDQQTHSLPAFENRRAAVAALSGYGDLASFDAAILETRRLVHRHYNALFADEARKRQAAVDGNLVFTGVDDDPGTVETLTGLGFSDPALVIEAIRNWHRGRTPATRTTRGRELLTALLPDLLAAMGKTGGADEAFRRFSRFFEGLRSGVQTLSMLVAEPDMMEDLVTTLALAPRIGGELSRRPGLLEALLSVSDRKTEPELSNEADFETAMELVRRWHGERAFITGHRLLHGKLAARDAAAEYSDLADTTVRLMAGAAERETVRRYGPALGQWIVAGLGKFGGQEMTAGSDLDLLVIYEAEDPAEAQTWFTRFTQRLITALSAETGEGALYEVDMRLRPSGRAGPVATSLVSFNRYHSESAWTWEHMALTRLRSVAGDTALGRQVEADAARHIVSGGDPEARTTDILDMRNRLFREKPPQGDWDLKMRAGGLVDIEFIIQHALLTGGQKICLPLSLSSALEALAHTPAMTSADTQCLLEAHGFLSALQQVQRVAVGAKLDDETLSDGLKDRLCRATGCEDFSVLKQRLERHLEVV